MLIFQFKSLVSDGREDANHIKWDISASCQIKYGKDVVSLQCNHLRDVTCTQESWFRAYWQYREKVEIILHLFSGRIELRMVSYLVINHLGTSSKYISMQSTSVYQWKIKVAGAAVSIIFLFLITSFLVVFAVNVRWQVSYIS